MMWPAPEPVRLTVYAGSSTVTIPVRKKNVTEKPVVFGPPEGAKAIDWKELRAASNSRKLSTDEKTGATKLEIIDDFGQQELMPHGLIIGGVGREKFEILPADPLSAKMETHWTETRKRGRWDIRTETYGRLTASKTHWKLWGKIEAFEGKKRIFVKEFNEEIERRLQ
jgi:hypothetical protein